MRRFLILWLVLASAPAVADEPDHAELVEQLRTINTDVGSPDGAKLSEAVPNDLRRRLRQANEQSTQQWQAIDSRQEWEKFRERSIAALRKSLNWPTERRPIEIQRTGGVEGEDFAVDNLLFESRRGVWVTANLYRPSKTGKVMPGILICHSHHNPRTESELQVMGMTWARAGCLVLVMDQFGHGERRQHPFVSSADYPHEFRAGRQDYWFRYDVSLQLSLAGESLMGHMAWDLSRGVDVLLAQDGIDPNRIVLLGAVAGGGDPAAVAAALDERITAVVPFNFGGPQPETRYPLPDDAETSFNYAGSGSWESTRNLARSASDGFLPWVIVGSVAPRKLIYAHEFSWDRERDPVWKRLNQIYEWYDAKDSLAFAHGTGLLTGKPPEASHCNNIGAVHRQHIHAALKQWYGIDVDPEKEYRKTLSADELRCVTPKVMPLQSLRVELRNHPKLDPPRFDKRISEDEGGERRNAQDRWLYLLEAVVSRGVEALSKKSETITSVDVDRVLLDAPVPVALLVLRPKQKMPAPVVVGIAQQGKKKFLAERSTAIAGLLERGIAVCLVDVRGTGETAMEDHGRDRTSHATALSASELVLGGTMMAQQLRDLSTAIDYLRSHESLDVKRLALWGESFAPVTPAEREIVVPHGVDRPGNCEPMGGMLALLAALNEEHVRAVAVHRGLSSYASALDGPCVYIPHDAVVPNIVIRGDIPVLAGALAPTPLRMWDLTDAMNRAVPDEEAKEIFPPSKNLEITPLADDALAEWFAERLGDK